MTPKEKIIIKAIVIGKIFFHHIYYKYKGGIVEVDKLVKKINGRIDKI